MSQNVLVGTNGQNQTGLYSSTSPIAYEEQATGSNGFGCRMTAVRWYNNWFTQPFATGTSADTVLFKSGHLLVFSVSNLTKSPGPSSFTFGNLVAGNYDTAINAMYDRIAALPFDSAVAGGSTYGGLTQPWVTFILQHEVDAANNLYGSDTASTFIAAWQHCWNLWADPTTGRAVANGVPTSRIHWCLNYTGYQIATRGPLYYPGDKYVDNIGIDPYTGPTSPVSYASEMSASWTFVKSKNKSISHPEINWIHTNTDSTAGQNWWIDVATQINASSIPYEFMCIWNAGTNTEGSNYYKYNFNKVGSADSINGYSFPLIHSGIGTMITNLGGNAIRTSAGQALPTAPTGLAGVSSTDGTQEALSWNANPSGDNITGWVVYRADGWVTGGGTRIATLNTATPRTYTDTGRTPGAKYTYFVAGTNATGTGPWTASPAQVQTQVPSAGNTPSISATSATVETANAQNVDFSCTASSPLSRPLTYNWTVTDANGNVVDTFAGASVTRTYQTQGGYSAVCLVVDNGTPALSTPSPSESFNITFNPDVTPFMQWGLSAFEPNQYVELIGKNLIPILLDLDTKLNGLLNSKGEIGELYGTEGQTFDPGVTSASTVSLAGGKIIWGKLKCRGTTISQIGTLLTTAQTGTGSIVAICDVNGNAITVDGTSGGALAVYSGTNVDAWLSATGDRVYELDTAISGVLNGEDVTVVVFSPSSGVSVFASFVATNPATAAAVANGNSAAPLWGSATGQTGIANPLPFGSYVACNRPYFSIA